MKNKKIFPLCIVLINIGLLLLLCHHFLGVIFGLLDRLDGYANIIGFYTDTEFKPESVLFMGIEFRDGAILMNVLWFTSVVCFIIPIIILIYKYFTIDDST